MRTERLERKANCGCPRVMEVRPNGATTLGLDPWEQGLVTGVAIALGALGIVEGVRWLRRPAVVA